MLNIIVDPADGDSEPARLTMRPRGGLDIAEPRTLRHSPCRILARPN